MNESNAPSPPDAGTPRPQRAERQGAWRWAIAVAVLLCALCAAALGLVWNTQQRVRELEQQLVKRQQDSSAQSAEARMLARTAEDTARDAAARVALVDARVTEATAQRSQLDELMQSLSRSREESVLADIETALRMAMQQSAITGSAEPLVVVLRQTDERLARQTQPRLEAVHRAARADLERLRAAALPDVATLAARLDTAIRQIDDLPLLSEARSRASGRQGAAAATLPSTSAASAAASASAAAPAAAGDSWQQRLAQQGDDYLHRIWDAARSLVRVTPIDEPEAMLLAPQQAAYLRANLKLRLLNARLALLGRQFGTAQADLRDAQLALQRYFDRSSSRVTDTVDLLRQVSTQAHQVQVPRPDATLAAIAAVSAAR